MNNKKESERAELHRAIWNIANDLRGAVDGWDSKQYVLGMLFYRYISENLTNYINKGEWDAGNKDFDYAKLSDEEAGQARPELEPALSPRVRTGQLRLHGRRPRRGHAIYRGQA